MIDLDPLYDLPRLALLAELEPDSEALTDTLEALDLAELVDTWRAVVSYKRTLEILARRLEAELALTMDRPMADSWGTVWEPHREKVVRGVDGDALVRALIRACSDEAGDIDRDRLASFIKPSSAYRRMEDELELHVNEYLLDTPTKGGSVEWQTRIKEVR